MSTEKISEWEKRYIQLVSRYFGGIYSHIYTIWKRRRVITKLVQQELQGRKKLTKILDVGCMWGDYVLSMNEDFGKKYSVEFHGIDLSPVYIGLAEKRSQLRNETNCWFDVGTAEDMPLPSEEFDIVICSEVLEHLKSPEKAIAELKRVTRKGGLLLISTPNKGSPAMATIRTVYEMKMELNMSGIVSLFRPIRFARKVKERLENRPEGPTEAEFGYHHINVKKCREWVKMCRERGVKVNKILSQHLVAGDGLFDRNPALFGIILILDSLLDHLPFAYNLSCGIVLVARKEK